MRKHTNDGGGVIVFLALTLVLIILLVALAIDTTVAASSKAHYEDMVEYAALAALEAYVESPAPLYQDKLNDAAQKARSVIGYNIPLNVGYSRFLDPAQPQDDLQPAQSTTPGGDNGKLIPGIWHFEEAENCDNSIVPGQFPAGHPCHCPGGPGTGQPCFEEVQLTEQANAMKVELRLHADSPLKTVFARIAGFHTVTYHAGATASLVPRHGVFLFDLSRSIYRDTHWFYNTGFGADYAYFVDPAFGACPASPDGTLYPASEQARYGSLGPVRPPGPIDPTRHYKAGQDGVTPEFECRAVDPGTRLDTGAVLPTEYYFMDQIAAADLLLSPEPLSSVLGGIHLAMGIFENRSVTGDLVSVIGFDDNLLSSRTMELIDPDLVNPGPYQDYYDATDSSDLDNKVAKFLFPRMFGRNGVPAKTDVARALTKALAMLAGAPGFQTSESFVVLFSDGFTNCSDSQEDHCLDDETHFNASIGDVFALLADFEAQNISVHVILVGDKAGPHTLLVKNGDGCLTDAEARGVDPPIAFVNPFDGSAWGDNPFFGPNELYNGSFATNGLWAPLRPCCTTGVGQACDTEDLTDRFDEACADSGVADGELVTSGVHPNIDGTYLDGHGRLLCDPQGRSKRTQVQHHIEEIMGTNPLVLVE